MTLSVGLDVSLEKTAICVLGEHGTIMKETQVASEAGVPSGRISDRDGAVTARRA